MYKSIKRKGKMQVVVFLSTEPSIYLCYVGRLSLAVSCRQMLL